MLETKCFTVREDACLIEAKPSACDLLPKAATSAAAVLAGEEGFEPSNAGIKIRCLNQLGDSPTVYKTLPGCRMRVWQTFSLSGDGPTEVF